MSKSRISFDLLLALKSYAYDGLHRRISETAGGVTTDFYYSDQWQVLEERVGGNAKVQYVWSPVYVDALILRDRDTDGDGTLDERLWVVQDANFNVTAVVDGSGEVVERYVYDPFGQATVLDAEWNVRSGGSAYDWLYLHQGGRYDLTSGLYHFRFRDDSPTLGRWTSLDPLSYAAGDVNLYRTVGNNPLNSLDPSGLDDVRTVSMTPPLPPPTTPRCIACHNPHIMGGGRVEDLPLAYQIAAMRWTRTEDPHAADAVIAHLKAVGQNTRRAASMVVDFIPVAGQVKGGVEAGIGFDPIAMERLDELDRALAIAGLMPGGKLFGRVARHSDNALDAVRAIDRTSDALGVAPRTGPGVFRSEADLLRARLGPARVSHPEEYASIIRELENAGVQIDYRPGCLAYSPEKGGPGKIVLDPDASIGALRHEFRHFADVRDAGFPGNMAYWYRRPREFARHEVRGYLEEIRTARELGHHDLVPKIVEQMRDRIRYLRQLEGW